MTRFTEHITPARDRLGGVQPQVGIIGSHTAPIDGAQAVVVKFTGIELTGNSGNPIQSTFPQPKSIDLVNQSGTASWLPQTRRRQPISRELAMN